MTVLATRPRPARLLARTVHLYERPGMSPFTRMGGLNLWALT
jgi:hypothetical protein